jgi:hypothetical protein
MAPVADGEHDDGQDEQPEEPRRRGHLLARLIGFVVAAIVAVVVLVVAFVAVLPDGPDIEQPVSAFCLPAVEVSSTRVARGSELVVSSEGFGCDERLSKTSTALVHLRIDEREDDLQLARIDVGEDGSFRVDVRIPGADDVREPTFAVIVVSGDAFRCGGDSCFGDDEELLSEPIEYVPL